LKFTKKITILLFFILSLANSYGQENSSFSIHPFSNSICFTLEGGVTYTNSDFKNNRFDYLGRGMIEYYFYSNNIGTFGLRLFGGLSYLGGTGSANLENFNIETLKTGVYYVAGGYSYTVSLNDLFYPYLFAGLSYIEFYPRGDNNVRISSVTNREFAKQEINYVGEAGLRILFDENFSLNFSGTININPNDNLDGVLANKNDDAFYSGNIGLSYYFLHAQDSDGDGVDDSEDQCPNTLPHKNVNEFGCPLDSDNDGVPDDKDICPKTPISIVVDEKGCPIDSDRDGIPDSMDKCLHTPRGIEVDRDGCPIDSDMDGVADFLDQCPKTAKNVVVDERGCEKKILQAQMPEINENIFLDDESLILVLSSTANFKTGKSELLPNPKSGLDRLIEFMKENLETKWVIEGHADNRGKDNLNEKLSLDRAKSVLNYFRHNGLDVNRFEVINSGTSKPIADNSIEFGRALNRRVVIQEKDSFEERQNRMQTRNSIEYDFDIEYNIESFIFTDSQYYCIQVSSWKTREKAAREVEKLRANGHSAFFILYQSKQDNQRWFRVRIGFFDNLQGTKEYLNRVR
jgi:OmpA-OmpF porin, OOP family